MSSSVYCPRSSTEFTACWTEAQELGWQLHNEYVVPPRHFPCKNWAAVWQALEYNGRTLYVPHWFWDDHVRRQGQWA